MVDVIVAFLSHYPIVLKLVTVMGTFRLIMKPIMLCIDQVVVVTKTTADNTLWAKVKASKVYKVVSLVLDYVASVKLPQA